MKRLSVWIAVALAVLAGGCSQQGPAAVGALSSAEASTPRATPTLEPSAEPTMSAAATPAPTPVFRLEPTGPTQIATVVSVTDGDTIRVLLDGENVPVRYIGIDAPETQNGAELMGAEATEANASLVEGRQVVLETDVSETDQYGRLLRYVWIEDGAGWVLVNEELLRLGVAQVTTFPPDVKYVDRLFVPAQAAAQAAALGLWAAVANPTPAPILPIVGGNCEASYPDVCIPIGSADIDCGEITAGRFTVLWNVPNPDPHGFDGDQDGIGCES